MPELFVFGKISAFIAFYSNLTNDCLFISFQISDKQSSPNYRSGQEINTYASSDGSNYDKNLKNKSLSINNCSTSNNGHKQPSSSSAANASQHHQHTHQQKPLSSSVNNFSPATNFSTNNSSFKNSSSHALSTGQPDYCDKNYSQQQQQSKNGNSFVNTPSTSYNQELMLNDSNDSSPNTLNLKSSSPNYNNSSGSNFSNNSSNQNISSKSGNNAQQPQHHSSSNRSSTRSYNPNSNQTLISSCQGSFHSLHGAGGGSSNTSADYQPQQLFTYGAHPTSSYHQHGGAQQQTSSHHQQQPYSSNLHQATNLVQPSSSYRHQHSVTSSDSLSGSGTLVYSSGRSRVNSDSNNISNTKSNSSNNNSFKTSGNNSTNSQRSNRNHENVANGANNNKFLNKSNNTNLSSSSNNNSNNNTCGDSNQLRQRHIIELNRQVSELNNKNIEFNRQLSAPTENQNSYNSVYNLYSNHILNNQYHSGSPNTNSLNRTKKKRSFKLNGR